MYIYSRKNTEGGDAILLKMMQFSLSITLPISILKQQKSFDGEAKSVTTRR